MWVPDQSMVLELIKGTYDQPIKVASTLHVLSSPYGKYEDIPVHILKALVKHLLLDSYYHEYRGKDVTVTSKGFNPISYNDIPDYMDRLAKVKVGTIEGIKTWYTGFMVVWPYFTPATNEIISSLYLAGISKSLRQTGYLVDISGKT